jgi:hypothetical protein
MDLRIKRGAGVVVAVAALLSLAAAAPARADEVTDWHKIAYRSLTIPLPDGRVPSPPVTTIHLAMMHGAVYDAVNAIDRRYQPYLVSPRAKWWYSKEAAAATAAYRVLLGIVPEQEAVLTAEYVASLAGIPPGKARDRGIAVGRKAAKAMLAARANDGRWGAPGFAVGDDPGEWRPVPPAFGNDANAWVKDVRPFMIRAACDFRSDGPNPLWTRAYAKEFAEVKELGSLTSSTRTADQTLMARFWSEGPAIWSRILQDLSLDSELEIADNARLFAMVYLTGADALIAIWDDKAYWSFWRPITAIREAGNDRNRATEPDPAWVPLIGNPPYPDHPSGLAGVISAMADTTADFFGTDQVEYSATSTTPNWTITRSFTSFSQATQEVVDARVYSGIHFRIADEHGAEIGSQVADWREKYFFHRAWH